MTAPLGHPSNGVAPHVIRNLHQASRGPSVSASAPLPSKPPRTGGRNRRGSAIMGQRSRLPRPEETSSERPAGLPKLLDKAEVCAIAGASFPTIWAWMRAGRSQIQSGSGPVHVVVDRVEAWMHALPRRALKGDQVKP